MRLAEHVATFEQQRNRAGLNRRGGRVTGTLDRGHQGRCELEVFEVDFAGWDFVDEQFFFDRFFLFFVEFALDLAVRLFVGDDLFVDDLRDCDLCVREFGSREFARHDFECDVLDFDVHNDGCNFVGDDVGFIVREFDVRRLGGGDFALGDDFVRAFVVRSLAVRQFAVREFTIGDFDHGIGLGKRHSNTFG